MPACRRPRAGPAGFVLPGLLAVAAIVLLIVIQLTGGAARRALAHRMQQDQVLLDAAAQRLAAWYGGHLAALDGAAGPGSGTDPVAALAGLPGQERLQITREPVSGAQPGSLYATVPGQRLVIALRQPLADLPTPQDRRVVDGQRLESEAIAQATRQLRILAGLLEQWSAARAADDPRHRMDSAPFQALFPGCGVSSAVMAPGPAGVTAASAALPCPAPGSLADPVPFFRAVLGQPPAALVLPWGDAAPLQVRQLQAGPPAVVQLELQVPGGPLLAVQAIQGGG